jgi:hypothetical protein
MKERFIVEEDILNTQHKSLLTREAFAIRF